jgi:hypothetical protein
MTAHDLVTDLGRAYREGRLDRRMRVYLAPKVLIIDEMGYLPLDELGATIFFQLVSARYERGSIILTSNKSYGDWGSIFGDPIIATAILDRLLHHSTTINIRGESYRLKDRRKAGSREKRTAEELPPSPHRISCRTVLAGKGPLRRAKTARPCLLRAVPQNLADMRGRGQNAKFWGGDFSTGEVGKFQPALTNR